MRKPRCLSVAVSWMGSMGMRVWWWDYRAFVLFLLIRSGLNGISGVRCTHYNFKDGLRLLTTAYTPNGISTSS